MLGRLVAIVGHIGAVAAASGLVLLVSSHTASSDRPFAVVRDYGEALTSRVLKGFEPLERLYDVWRHHLAFDNSDDSQIALATVLRPSGLDQFEPPAIGRVVVAPGGKASLSGRATPGVKVAIYSGGRELGSVDAEKDGGWELALDSGLSYGSHRIHAVAWTKERNHYLPGQEVRIALPQSIAVPMVVHGDDDAGKTRGNAKTGHRQRPDNKGEFVVAQADPVGSRDDDEFEADQDDDFVGGLTAPVYRWLRQSSEAYDAVIVQDLSGRDAGFAYITGQAQREADVSTDDDDRDTTDRQSWITSTWPNFTLGIREWLRQARESYTANIVDELSTGTRQSRDEFVRADPERQPPRYTDPRDDQDFRDDRWREEPDVPPVDAAEPDEPDRRAEVPGDDELDDEQQPEQSLDWPVVEDAPRPPPALPEVAPSPENEALIRRAQQEAERARELARRAAAQAERARKETEAMLAEERRLKDEGVSQQEADRRAREAERQRLLAEAKERAEAAKREAQAAAEAEQERERETDTAVEQDLPDDDTQRQAEPTPVDETEQRRAAEELAAAATKEADKRFAAGEVRDRGPRETFTAADDTETRRLSLKDKPGDAVEEGSTLGDVDDFDPSVRYIYDMGEAAPVAKPKRKAKKIRKHYRKRKAKRRSYSKRRSYRRSAKRKRAYKRYAKRKRAYKRRAYRNRRTYGWRRYRAKHRIGIRRWTRRIYRHVRRATHVRKVKRRYYKARRWRRCR